MGWVLEVAGGWLSIIFDYGRLLACTLKKRKIGLLFGGGRVSDLGSFT